MIPIDEHSFYLCPWIGTKELTTIKALLSNGLKSELMVYSVISSRHYLQVTTGLSVADFVKKVRQLNVDIHCPDLVLPIEFAPKIDKYDPMVPDMLLRKAALYNQFDVPVALEYLQNVSV